MPTHFTPLCKITGNNIYNWHFKPDKTVNMNTYTKALFKDL